MESAELNLADLAILVVVLLSCVLGLWRGLVREVLSLLTWVAAIAAVWLFGPGLAETMAAFIEQPLLRAFAAFVILFLGVMIAGAVLIQLISGVLALAGLTVVDRVLGTGFGALRGALIVCLVLFLAAPVFAETGIWTESALIPFGLALIDWVPSLMDWSAAPFDQSQAGLGI